VAEEINNGGARKRVKFDENEIDDLMMDQPKQNDASMDLQEERKKAVLQKAFFEQNGFSERPGNIFIDRVRRVVGAVKNKKDGSYDYLLEWKQDGELALANSVVKGAAFVQKEPLLFRRYMEKEYVSKRERVRSEIDFGDSQATLRDYE